MFKKDSLRAETFAYQSSDHYSRETSPTVAPPRIARSHRRRAEEQVICAILHTLSLYGLLAIAATGVVWTTQRTRSRFVAFQSLQALIFQLFTFLALLVVFGLFMAGFFFAASSGLIARTGVTEPELTTFLINAALLGFGCILFFLWIFPLWGVWAAMRIVRGRNFRYPILGRLADIWLARQSITTESVPANRNTNGETSNSESMLAGLGHLSLLGGFSLVLTPILWATAKQRSEFLTNHLLQAALFQLLALVVILPLFFGILGLPLLFILLSVLLPPGVFEPVSRILALLAFPSSCIGMIGVFLLIIGVLALVAAIRACRGKEFRYPVVGRWLANYLNSGR